MQLEPQSKARRNLIGGSSILMLLIAIWVAIPAVSRWSSASASVPLDRLRIAEVVRGDLVRDVSVQGRVVAAVSPTLYASAPGSITLLVEAGASVEEGQVLAQIKSPELENGLKQAQASFEEQADLVEADPDKFYIPSYVGAKGWVAIRLDQSRVDWPQVDALLVDAYRAQAPKKLAAQVA